MIVDFVRHASTGRSGCFDGRTDPPLLPAAADALRASCGELRWAAAISSPRQRARLTAEALVAVQGLPVAVSEDWAEWHFGEWDGRHRDAIAADEAGRRALAEFYRDPAAHPPPGAEPWTGFRDRIHAGLLALAHRRDEEGLPLLVVSHAGPLRLALSLACGLPLPALWALRLDYGTRLRLRVEADADDRLWGELIEVRPA